jgi:AcrR family transcriptional regulator
MTRDEVLNIAAQVISQKGYHAASMQDIASAVGIKKASLYHHISSKQEILFVLLDQALELLTQRMQVALGLPLSPEQKLRQAISSYLETMLENRDLAAVLLLEYRSLEADQKSRHIPRRDQYEGLWKTLIQEGIDQGIFQHFDVGLEARSLLGVMNWTITWFRVDGKLTPRDIAQQIADLFLLGLLTRS